MDIQEEREAFESTLKQIGKVDDSNFTVADDGSYEWDSIHFAWTIWQAAKAQAVPEWISTSERMPEEGEEVFVHSLGQVRQATRDSSFAGGFKERNCYGWQATYSQSHWMPKSIKLPEQYHFYYEFEVLMNDSKQKAMIKAQEQDQ